MGLGYHGKEKQPEGFDRIEQGQWVHFSFANQQGIYCHIVGRTDDGFDVKTLHQNAITRKNELRDGTVKLEHVVLCECVSKEEAEHLLENEPSIARHYGKPVIFEVPGGIRAGVIKHLLESGIILNPYVHRKVADGKLEWRNADYIVSTNQVNTVAPASMDEISGFIATHNAQLDAQQKPPTENPAQLRLPFAPDSAPQNPR